MDTYTLHLQRRPPILDLRSERGVFEVFGDHDAFMLSGGAGPSPLSKGPTLPRIGQGSSVRRDGRAGTRGPERLPVRPTGRLRASLAPIFEPHREPRAARSSPAGGQRLPERRCSEKGCSLRLEPAGEGNETVVERRPRIRQGVGPHHPSWAFGRDATDQPSPLEGTERGR